MRLLNAFIWIEIPISNMKAHTLFLLGLFCLGGNALAQNTPQNQVDSEANKSQMKFYHVTPLIKNKVEIGAFLDVYYQYQFNQPKSGDVPYFVSSNRHNEMSVNLAYLDIKYTEDRMRMHFIPGFGGYMDANYAAETGSFKHFVEANIGVKPFRQKNIWIDAGVLPSPFSTETAISKDQPMYTRSLAPEYVPYYLSGVKLTVPIKKDLTTYWYIVNGWQNIRDNNQQKSIVGQFEFVPNNNHTFIGNVYVGQEQFDLHPDWRIRTFYDLQWTCKINKALTAYTCVYLGQQNRVDSVNQTSKAQWGQANTVLKWTMSNQSFLSFRMEYFKDMSGIQLQSINPVPGSVLYGSGLCYSHMLGSKSMFRLEYRALKSPYAMFNSSNGYGLKSSQSLVANLSAWF